MITPQSCPCFQVFQGSVLLSSCLVTRLNTGNVKCIHITFVVTTCQYDVIYGAVAQWLQRWIPSPGVPCSRPLGGSNVVSAFHLSKIDQMITRNFWEESVRKLTASSQQLYIQLPMFYHLKHQPHKMVKYTRAIRWQQATN